MRGARLAERSIGVSSSPDTKTRFVWVGAERKAYANKTLYLVIESGGHARVLRALTGEHQADGPSRRGAGGSRVRDMV